MPGDPERMLRPLSLVGILRSLLQLSRSTTLSKLGLLLIASGIISIAQAAIASEAKAPAPSPAPIESPREPSPIIPASTTEPPAPAPADALCPGWWEQARRAGWAEEDLASLDLAMYKESRCDPSQLNASDPHGGSLGLLQINSFWCLPSRYSPGGWLQEQGILSACPELYEPEVALRAGLAIFRYAEERAPCGWSPWATMTCP